MNVTESIIEQYYSSIENVARLRIQIRKTPLVIFGCGNLGRKIANFLVSEEGYDVVAFADNNSTRWGQKINDISVVSPKEACTGALTPIFIVSIWSPNNSYVAIKKQLHSLGAINVIHAAQLMHLFPENLLPHYQFETPEYYIRQKNEIERVYELLEDTESKMQFLAHIDCRINLNFEALPSPDIHNQYFPAGIVTLSNNEFFFDAGAFDGDTLKCFIDHLPEGTFTKYIALEPDPANKEKLANTIRDLNTNNVVVYPYAVGSQNGILKFDATGGGGAGLSEKGTIEVECVRIDDTFLDEPITFLKFDIEGAEMGALQGARETILRHKPIIAVCIYHLPDDLWTIPLYLKEQYPFYKFFARTHQFDGLDFVLYAIPQ